MHECKYNKSKAKYPYIKEMLLFLAYSIFNDNVIRADMVIIGHNEIMKQTLKTNGEVMQ